MPKEIKYILNNHFAYIALIIQILFFVIYYINVINENIGVPSYFLAIYFLLLYAAILYSYIRFQGSIKMTIVYSLVEVLVFIPVIILLYPYHCGKCDETSQLFLGAHYYLAMFIVEWLVGLVYLKIVSVKKLETLRPLMYTLPAIIILLPFVVLNMVLDQG